MKYVCQEYSRIYPVIGSGQHARIPESWLENRHGADGKRRERQRMGAGDAMAIDSNTTAKMD